MPQETNLNVSPYFDDFDKDKNYYKVLWKPGYPVQARELNTSQSISQNQIEQFGKHIFKEGSVVIPGQLRYENPLYSVELESEHNGIPVSLYFNNLIGAKVRGQNSNVKAEIVFLLSKEESTRSNYTIYVKYLQSGGENFDRKVFSDGETLLLETPVIYGNSTIQTGQGFATTLFENAISEGSAASVANGVYFVRGFFVNVSEQTILLDQYGINPSYRVGFNVLESTVTSDDDNTLFDNAQGFTNFAAPGADRFKLELELAKKDLTDNNTESFVEIFRVENGVPQFFDKNPQYNLIRDELARRTFDESGNYFVKDFSLFVRDSLNDRVRNNGMFFENQRTPSNNIPSEDLMVYQIGPGKAYVSGYDVEVISSRLLEVEKPRTTQELSDQVITYNSGALSIVNNTFGAVYPSLGTTAVVSLMDARSSGVQTSVSTASTIGVARVYDFIPETDYVDQTSRLHLRLFDIQTYTNITLTTPITISTPAQIKGKRSNATGYLTDSVAPGTTLQLYNVSGQFLENEPILVDGVDNGRLITNIQDYDLRDVKSILGENFNSDLVLNRKFYIAKPGTTFQITAASNGISTVSAGLKNTFTNFIRPGDIISYTSSTFTGNPIYNEVVSVSAGGTNFTIQSVPSIPDVCDGSLPGSTYEITNIIRLQSTLNANNASLLTRLSDDNVESLNFNGNEVLQRRTFTDVVFSGNTLTIEIPAEDTDIFFASFNEDRYTIIYSDGTIEPLRSDKYFLDPGGNGKTLIFNGLTMASGIADVIATVRNLKISSKIKKLNKTSSIVVSNSRLNSSGIGTTTTNDGLTFSAVYGTRVQDDEISLNVPDVVRVLAIYESTNTNDPILPNITLNGFSGTSNNTSDFVVGETIVGQTSGCAALVTKIIDSTRLEYVGLNAYTFSENETILGKQSNIEAIISNVGGSSKNVTQNYSLDNGQRDSYYDYSRIIRKKNATAPIRKLKVIFQNYTIDSTDEGEILTVNSYNSENFKYDVPYYQNSRLTDYIDLRPRVKPYILSDKSPFEFDSREFTGGGQFAEYILVPEENLFLNYSYYLGRIDRVFLNPDGTFEISKGEPGISPSAPPLKSNSIDIATVYLPPYVYNTKNVSADMAVHKRYRMSDISLLEDRIKRVEKYTTLTMLESKTENYKIKDAETGLDRFKCGFFVDNFSSHKYHDLKNINFKSAIDTSKKTLRPKHYTTSLDLQLGSEAISGFTTTFNSLADQSYVQDLGSIGVRKTGDLITLDYNEVLYYSQPYATKTESVTPFLVRYWAGSVILNPPLDTWIEERSLTTTATIEDVQTTIIPDENITVVENVFEDNTDVFVDPINQQSNTNAIEWIETAKSILSANNLRIGGILVNRIVDGVLKGPNSLGVRDTSGFFNNNTLHLEVKNSEVSSTDRELIRSLLPPDVAEDYINQVNTSNLARTVLVFNASEYFGGEFNVETTTTTSSETNTETIIIPEEIITTETTSESISNWDEPVRFLRSRNIEFDVKGLRPVTHFYSFFEGVDIKDYITPKLLEINMISGKFQIGETVESDPFFTDSQIIFRLCAPNHRTGPFDGSNPPEITNPVPRLDFSTGQVIPASENEIISDDVYKFNPYTQQEFESNYSESTTLLNVDTRALQLPSEVEFYGLVKVGMRLIGRSSNAVAEVTNIRLISDNNGRLIGSLFIPDPTVRGNPRWVNGSNTFTVIDTSSLSNLENTFDEFVSNSRVSESSAETEFESSGVRNVEETTITTTRNIQIIPSRNINTTTITNTTTTTSTVEDVSNGITLWETHDPLAQSFYVRDDGGIFITSCDVYFETKDDEIPVTIQIRPMTAGVPSNMVVPFSEVTLNPSEINLSTDGSVPTRVRFPSPVYLNGPAEVNIRNAPIGSQQTSEYALVLQSDSPNYRVFISELGENDILTGVRLSQQYTLGSLFKSQNGTTWTPAQLEDLKYNIYRADFVSEGIVRFFNPKLSLGNKKVAVLGPNQFNPLSKKALVGLGSTGFDSVNVVPGVTITQNNGTSGILDAIAGNVDTLSVVNSGVGYTTGTYNGVTLVAETGFGDDLIANITVSVGGTVQSVTVVDGGYGYELGDSVIIPESETSMNVGFGAKFAVSSLATQNSFVINNIQGKFEVGITTLNYIDSSGSEIEVGAGVTIQKIIDDQYYDGLHMKVYHSNHGMHSSENYVKISKFRPLRNDDYQLTQNAITITESTPSIPVTDSSIFNIFEGFPVSVSNPGYVIIGQEVLKYTDTSNNTISITERGIDGTRIQPIPVGKRIYKYEFNGISLRRINKVHSFGEVDTSTHLIDLNSYHIKIDMSDTDFEGSVIGVDRSPSTVIGQKYFNETVQTGNKGTNITQNIQFEVITPNVTAVVPSGTNLGSRVRTFTGQSVGGSENSFEDSGFNNIKLNDLNYFDSPRIIASRENENRLIEGSPGNRSFELDLLLDTQNSRVSPVIDTIQTSVILTTNLINNPIGVLKNSNYANDDRVRSLDNDPHAMVYVSKPVRLKIPANSLHVILSAKRNTVNDVRVLYQIFRSDSPELSSFYELFPGHSNYKVDGNGIKQVIDKSQNDGSQDSFVQQTSEYKFRGYTYSVDNLPDFDAFAIKIVTSSENQALPPLIKDLRAIATIKPRI